MHFIVPMTGVEPARPRGQWILNPSRLPIPPHRHKVLFSKLQIISLFSV